MYGINLSWNGTAAAKPPFLLGWGHFISTDWATKTRSEPYQWCIPDDSLSRRENIDDDLSAQMMRLSQASFKEIWSDPAEDIWDNL